ncbi:hypothetical protein LINGRAHAP2_LOCUS14472 [Linum grandiflorum]
MLGHLRYRRLLLNWTPWPQLPYFPTLLPLPINTQSLLCRFRSSESDTGRQISPIFIANLIVLRITWPT